MEKELDYNNLGLRNKTFLDFTSDPKIIEDIVGSIPMKSSDISEQGRILTFMEFAELTDDTKLAKAIKQEFQKDLELIFNE